MRTGMTKFVIWYTIPCLWVSVTTAWRVHQVADGGTASDMEGSCEYIE